MNYFLVFIRFVNLNFSDRCKVLCETEFEGGMRFEVWVRGENQLRIMNYEKCGHTYC